MFVLSCVKQRIAAWQRCSTSFVLDLEVAHAVHVELLGHLEVLLHRLLARHALVPRPPGQHLLGPLLARHVVLLEDVLRQQLLLRQLLDVVHVLVVVAELGLHGVRRQQHRRLRVAVDLVGQDRLFHLRVEQLLQSETITLKSQFVSQTNAIYCYIIIPVSRIGRSLRSRLSGRTWRRNTFETDSPGADSVAEPNSKIAENMKSACQ